MKVTIKIMAIFIAIIAGCNNKNSSNNDQVPVQNVLEIRAVNTGSFMTWNPVYEGGNVGAGFEFVNDGTDYSGNWFAHTVQLYKKVGSEFIEIPLSDSGIVVTPVGNPAIPGLKWKNGEIRSWIFGDVRVQDSGRYKYKVTLTTPIGAIEEDVSNNTAEIEFDVIKYPSTTG